MLFRIPHKRFLGNPKGLPDSFLPDSPIYNEKERIIVLSGPAGYPYPGYEGHQPFTLPNATPCTICFESIR